MARARALLLTLCAVVALALASDPATAAPRKMATAARKHLVAGKTLFARGRYAEAIREFDAGYALDAHPDFLYARGQALRLSGDCAHAIDDYRRFIATAPPAAEERLARENLARCEEAVAARPAPSPAPTTPPPAPTATAPPPRAAERPRPPPPSRPFYLDPVGDGLAAVGLVGAAAGVYFLVSADRHVDAANAAEDLGVWQEENDAVGRSRLIGGVALGVGAAAITGALLRWLVWPGGPEVGAEAGEEHARLWVGGRF